MSALSRETMLRVADDLRHLVSNASDADRSQSWFSYAERAERQLRDAAGERECPRFEFPGRVVIEVDLTDGRAAELTYEATMWAGERSEPSNGFIGGPEVDRLTLVRVTAGDNGVPASDWQVLVPKEAEALADEAADLFLEQLSESFREAHRG